MDHSIHNSWHQQTAHLHDAINTVCYLPCTVKTGIHPWREHLFKVSRRHRMWAFAHSSRLRRLTAVRSRPQWGRRACRWASLRRFLTVCAEILLLFKPIVVAAVRVDWSQMILEVKMLDVEVLGWSGYTWSAVVKPVGCTAKFSEMPLEMAYGREMNIQFTGNSYGGHSCSQHANCTLPQNLRHLWHCAVWYNCTF